LNYGDVFEANVQRPTSNVQLQKKGPQPGGTEAVGEAANRVEARAAGGIPFSNL
jgi:hypothetical protein